MTTAETIRGVLTALVVIPIIAAVSVQVGMIAILDIRIRTRVPELDGTTEIPDTHTTTPATTVGGDRSIKN
jgi:hypothetical protein